jgi:hypothetical protein
LKNSTNKWIPRIAFSYFSVSDSASYSVLFNYLILLSRNSFKYLQKCLSHVSMTILLQNASLLYRPVVEPAVNVKRYVYKFPYW